MLVLHSLIALLLITLRLTFIDVAAVPSRHKNVIPEFVIALALDKSGFAGGVHPRGGYDPGYNEYRRVKNGACNVRYPKVRKRVVQTILYVLVRI